MLITSSTPCINHPHPLLNIYFLISLAFRFPHKNQLCHIKQIVYYRTKSLQIVMAPSRICPNGLKVAVTVAFIFSITFLISSVWALNSGHSEKSTLQQSKKVLGSKPPGCVNKCLSCRPCMATLVIPSHQWKNLRATYHGDEDDSYYLLSWKCKCGDKLFQP